MNNCFIIESDLSSIKTIQNLLADFPEFRLMGISNNRDAVMNDILKEKPDLVFINIDSVIEKPFEFTKEIGQLAVNPPKFLALSSSGALAYDAIKQGFFDYILLPLKELELRKSLLKYQKKYLADANKTICLKSYKDYQYLNTDEILFLKADNNTTDFYMKDGSVVSAFKTLKTFESVLPGNFLRIHKSYIINSNYVSRIQYGKSLCTISKNNFHIPFTKTFIDNVEEINNSLYKSSYLSLN